MRRVSYLRWAVLLLAASLLSGCSVLTKQELKPVPETLTHGRFVYLADRICARDLRHTKKVFKRPKSHAQYDQELQAVLKGYEDTLFDLRALAPPASDAESFRHVLAAFNLQDLLGHNLLEAGDLGQVTRVKTLFRKLRANGITLKARSLELGLHVCAKE